MTVNNLSGLKASVVSSILHPTSLYPSKQLTYSSETNNRSYTLTGTITDLDSISDLSFSSLVVFLRASEILEVVLYLESCCSHIQLKSNTCAYSTKYFISLRYSQKVSPNLLSLKEIDYYEVLIMLHPIVLFLIDVCPTSIPSLLYKTHGSEKSRISL